MVNSVVGNSLPKGIALLLCGFIGNSSGPDVRGYILHKAQSPVEVIIIFCWISELS